MGLGGNVPSLAQTDTSVDAIESGFDESLKKTTTENDTESISTNELSRNQSQAA